jgi:hypothetical protein
MARARNIKPGFFKNEDLAECSPHARLCFIGLWILADRDGRLEDRPKRIKAELFPFDTVDVEPLLQELERFKFIVRYETDGMKAIQIPEFVKHQSPHYSEKPSVIKPPTLPESVFHEEPAKPENSKKTPGEAVSLRGGRNPLNPDLLNPDSLNPETPKPATKAASVSVSGLKAEGVDPQHAAEWLAVRKAKRLTLTQTAWNDTKAEAAKAGVTPAEAVRLSVVNSWAGFKASWLQNPGGQHRGQPAGDIFAGAM